MKIHRPLLRYREPVEKDMSGAKITFIAFSFCDGEHGWRSGKAPTSVTRVRFPYSPSQVD